MPSRTLVLLAAMPFLFATAALAETGVRAQSERPDADRVAEHKAMCTDIYAHRAGRLATLEARLDLTAPQHAAWAKWQQASLDAATKERAACLETAPAAEGRPTAPEREARLEKVLTLKLQTLQSTRPAMQALYADLTADQKTIFDRAGHSHGHHGEGHGHQWFGGMRGER